MMLDAIPPKKVSTKSPVYTESGRRVPVDGFPRMHFAISGVRGSRRAALAVFAISGVRGSRRAALALASPRAAVCRNRENPFRMHSKLVPVLFAGLDQRTAPVMG